MGLMPDKPNRRRPSFADPRDGTRRCTRCIRRKSDNEFRWLLTGVRRASACKLCEAAARSRAGLKPAVGF